MISLPSASTSELEQYWNGEWLKFCDWVATKGPVGNWISNQVLRRLTINAPVIIAFVTICVVVHAITGWMGVSAGRILGVHDTWKFTRFWQYTSLLTHVFAHSSVDHLRGNVTHLLLVGPSVEHKFGSKNVAFIIVLVAIVSAIVHILVGRVNSHQLGASGVVFACILLNSLVSAEDGKIPLAFVLVAMMFLGEEVALFFRFWNPSNISHHAHLTGGLVGAAAGFYIHKQRRKEKARSAVHKWLASGSSKKKAT